MPTGLGRSLVEVQRCPTALRTLRLRSSRAHSDRCPLRAEVGEERRVGKAAVDVEVEAEVAEEKEEDEEEVEKEEEEEKKKKEEPEQPLPSNNPHLAGGE